MSEAARVLELSPEDYLALEERAETKSEYNAGQLWAVSGTTIRHNRVTLNIVRALLSAGSSCEVMASDSKLRVSDDKFYYPDVMVACDPTDDHPLYRRRPCLLVEVLSPGTVSRDRGEKFEDYLRLPSLLTYLLVHPETRRVEVYRREEMGWHYRFLEGTGELVLPCPPTTLSLDEVYAGL